MMKKLHVKRSGILFGMMLVATSSMVSAKVTLPAIFGSQMVLQRQMPVPVWGTANPGEKIHVALDKTQADATADDKGRWMAKLPAMEAGGPYKLTVQGEDTVTFDDVMVGEVWLCAGQSNMELKMTSAGNPDVEIANANHPDIRLFQEPHHVAPQPQSTCNAQWAACSPETVRLFSAAGYYFGRDLNQKLKVPVGLIEAAWGGKIIELFMSEAALKSDPDFQPILDRYATQLAAYPADWDDYDKNLVKLEKIWHAAKAKANADATPLPQTLTLPPSGIYNGEIAPLAPFAIRGAIWYQGESNAARAEQYGKLLPTMIKDWRQLWGEGDFPFIVVQLPNFMPAKPNPEPNVWAEMREAQTKALTQPNTAVTVNIDIGEAALLHPPDKQDVGHRLALAAERLAYKMEVADSGPVFKTMRIDGATAKIEFDDATGLKAKDGGAVLGFAIAGADRKYVWATGKVDGSSVVVQADGVTAPVAVRYDWAGNPNGNLYNDAGLPTRPFRTDDWPGLSTGKK